VVATTSATAREALIAAGWVLPDPMVRPMTDDLMDILRFLRPLW
jgi:hypothetical protein